MPDAPEARIRARAAQTGFSGARADTKVAHLSGGEKARLLLGVATFNAPHLLILDEPTNHLDIDSRAALIEAINDYEGAVVLVSHDRYLLEACADRLWLVDEGTVRAFDGDMDDYARMVLGRAERRRPQGARDARGAPEKRAKAPRDPGRRAASSPPPRSACRSSASYWPASTPPSPIRRPMRAIRRRRPALAAARRARRRARRRRGAMAEARRRGRERVRLTRAAPPAARRIRDDG